MPLGEVGVDRGTLRDGDAHHFRQFDQAVVAGNFLSRPFGDYQRKAAVGDEVGQTFNGIGSGLDLGGLGYAADFGRGSPVVDHRLYGYVQEGGALGDALGHLPGAHQLFVEGVGAGGLSAPFDEGVNEAVGAADHAEVAVPLTLGIKLGILAVAVGLARADQHGHLAEVGAVDAHATLEQAHTSVEQDGLHLARDPGVAQGHIHGEGFVPAVDVGWAIHLVYLLAGQGLPYGRPFRPRGGDDVVNAQVAEGFQDSVAAVPGVSLSHAMASRCWISGQRGGLLNLRRWQPLKGGTTLR